MRLKDIQVGSEYAAGNPTDFQTGTPYRVRVLETGVKRRGSQSSIDDGVRVMLLNTAGEEQRELTLHFQQLAMTWADYEAYEVQRDAEATRTAATLDKARQLAIALTGLGFDATEQMGPGNAVTIRLLNIEQLDAMVAKLKKGKAA